MVQLVGEFDVRQIEQAISFVEGLLEGLQDVVEETGGDLDNLGKSGGTGGGFRGIGQEIVDFDRGVQGVLDSIFNLRNALIGLGAGVVVNNLIDTATDFERIEKTLEIVAGRGGDVGEEFAFIRAEAERLGQPILTLGEGYAKLAVAAKGTALEGDGVRELFSSVLEATSLLGASGADTNGILVALTQILSKGKLSAEELRQQLGERLVGAFRIAAEAMDVTTESLDEMLKEGAILSVDFLPKFARQIRETFGTDASTVINTLTADLNRFGNDVDVIKLAITEGGFAEGITDSLAELREILQSPELQSTLASIGAFAGDVLVLLASNLDIIVNIVGTLIGLKLAAFFITSSQAVVEFVRVSVTGNPFGLLLRAVIALTPVILTLTDTSIPDLGRAFVDVVELIIRTLSGLVEAVPVALGSIPEAIAEVFFRGVELGATVIQGFVNTIIEFVNSISSLVGIELDPVNLIPDRVKTEFGVVGADIGEAFSRGFEEGFNILPPDEVVAASADATAASATAIEAAILSASESVDTFGALARERFADVVEGIDEATAAQERFNEGVSLAGFEVEASTASIGASFTGLGATIDDVFETAGGSGSIFTSGLALGLTEVGDTSTVVFEGAAGDVEIFRASSEEEFGGLFESATTVLETFGVSLEDVIGTRGVAIIEAFSNTTQAQWDSIVAAGQTLLGFFGIDLGAAVTVASDVFSAFTQSSVSLTSTSVGAITSLWSTYGGFFTGLSNDTASVWQATNFTMSADSAQSTGFISGLWSSFSGFFQGIGAGLTGIFSNFTATSSGNFAGFIGLAIAGIQNFGGVFRGVIDALSGAFRVFVDNASSAISGVVSAAGSAASAVIDTVGSAVRQAADLAVNVVGNLFAQGGVVEAEPFAAGGVVANHPLASIMVGFQDGGVGGRLIKRPETFGVVDGQGRRTLGIRGESGQEAIFPVAQAPNGAPGIIAQIPANDKAPGVVRQSPEIVVINAPRADEARMAEIEAMLDDLDGSIEERVAALNEDIFRGTR